METLQYYALSIAASLSSPPGTTSFGPTKPSRSQDRRSNRSMRTATVVCAMAALFSNILTAALLSNLFTPPFECASIENTPTTTISNSNINSRISELAQNSVEPSETLSSCLLIMDDNHRLPEWLAYHYFTMNMRHLVVLSDPAGRESPTRVLDPWREYITIEEWTEKEYFDDGLRQRTRELEGQKDPSPDDTHAYFLERQSKFIKSCVLHLQEHNRTWVSTHDIDEYYVINSGFVKNTKRRMEEPGSIIKLLNEVQEHFTGLQSMSNLVLPEQYTGPCVTTYRIPYSAVESSEEERGQDKDVPSFLDPSRLETLRWRHHGKKNSIGKSLIDVSKVPALKHMGWDRKRTPFSPHQLIPFCPEVRYHPNAFIVLNHYVGSWESYTYRVNDSRQGGTFKNRKEWEKTAYSKGGNRGNDIRPWITGFVQLFGEAKVKLLLGDSGLPTKYTVSVEADA
jgi:hypothetical protein